MQGDIFFIRTEREVGGGLGYLDMEFLVRANNPKSHAQYVFELKYLKKEDENQLASTQEAAETQLRNYLAKDETLKSLTKLRAFTIVVVKTKVYLKEVIFS